ncbi:MAG: hypothetical protein R3F49_16910 [Planctomycetota bacterium]
MGPQSLRAWVAALVCSGAAPLGASAASAAVQGPGEHISRAFETPEWLSRVLEVRAPGSAPAQAPLTADDEAHAGPLELALIVPAPERSDVADVASGGRPSASVDSGALERAGVDLEVLIERRPGDAAPWRARVTTDASGVARLARAPEGRVHVLLLDAGELVPDPARYGLLFEPFSGGPFPYLQLDEGRSSSRARVVSLFVTRGHAAPGAVTDTGGAALVSQPEPGAPDEGLAGAERAATRVWIASPGRVELARVAPDGTFTWHDPRPRPSAPFDPAAPTAGFLERAYVGVVAPPGARACSGLPLPPFGEPMALELVDERQLERALGAAPGRTAAHVAGALPTDSPAQGAPAAAVQQLGAGDPNDAASLALWRALRATPIAAGPPPPADAEARTAAALAKLRSVGRPGTLEGYAAVVAEALSLRTQARSAQAGARAARGTTRAEGALRAVEAGDLHRSAIAPATAALLRLAQRWLALRTSAAPTSAAPTSAIERPLDAATPDMWSAREQRELELLDLAQPAIATCLDLAQAPPDARGSAAEVAALQLWVSIVAPRYSSYAQALADRARELLAPRRALARAPLTADALELRASSPVGTIVAALRRRPSSTLGADLAPLVAAVPVAQVEVLLRAFAALASDPARGAVVRDGALDLLLALHARDRDEARPLADLVLATLTDEPRDAARAGAVMLALAPLAPERALTGARSVLCDDDAWERAWRAFGAGEVQGLTPGDMRALGALATLAALEPEAVARRARAAPHHNTLATALLTLHGEARYDLRRLSHDLLELLLQ